MTTMQHHKSAVGGDHDPLPRYGQVPRNRRATMPEEASLQPQQHNVMVLILSLFQKARKDPKKDSNKGGTSVCESNQRCHRFLKGMENIF